MSEAMESKTYIQKAINYQQLWSAYSFAFNAWVAAYNRGCAEPERHADMQRTLGASFNMLPNVPNCATCLHDVKAKDARIKALESALRQVEFQAVYDADIGYIGDLCPVCEEQKEKGHEKNCIIGMALEVSK